MLDVLLISPLDPEKPSKYKLLVGGENTYTRTLLNYPPHGIRFTHFQDALRRGEIRYTFWQAALSNLIRLRVLPPDAGYQCIRLNHKYDLVHCHSYCLKIDGSSKPPLVMSISSSNKLFLRKYLGWPNSLVSLKHGFRRWLHRSTNVSDPEHNLKDSRLIVFSEFAKKMLSQNTHGTSKITVIYPGIPDRKYQKTRKNNKKFIILFVGVWFMRKGGMVLLESFKELRKKYKNIHLIILGPLPQGVQPNDPNITQIDYVSLTSLHKDYYPHSDALVLVPPHVEGYGMVVSEAMSHGVPAIVSSVCALPEFIDHNQNGFIVKPGNSRDLTHVLKKLIQNPRLIHRFKREARERYLKQFSMSVSNKRLLAVYMESVRVYMQSLPSSPENKTG